jgi:hypothetical protein
MQGLTKAVAHSFVPWLPTRVAVLLEHLIPPAIRKHSELCQVPRDSNRDSLKNAIQSIRSGSKGAPCCVAGRSITIAVVRKSAFDANSSRVHVATPANIRTSPFSTADYRTTSHPCAIQTAIHTAVAAQSHFLCQSRPDSSLCQRRTTRLSMDIRWAADGDGCNASPI